MPHRNTSTNPLIQHLYSGSFQKAIKSKGTRRLDNVDPNLKELVIAGDFYFNRRHVIWVVGENENLAEKTEKIKLWMAALGLDPEIAFYTLPIEDPFVHYSAGIGAISQKIHLIRAIATGRMVILLTTLAALGIRMEGTERFEEFFISLKINDGIDRNDLIDRLVAMGYRSREYVEEAGDISWRGSVVDVFPVDSLKPVRFEIEEGRVLSLRYFSRSSQKSVSQLKEVHIPFSRYFLDFQDFREYVDHGKDSLKHVTDVLGKHTLVVSDCDRVNGEWQKLMDHYHMIFDSQEKKNKGDPGLERIFDFSLDGIDLLNITEGLDQISSFSEWTKERKSFLEYSQADLDFLKGYRSAIYYFSTDRKRIEHMTEMLPQVAVVTNKIPHSLKNNTSGALFITDRHYLFRESLDPDDEMEPIGLKEDIQPQDLVVHQKHGVGRFIQFQELSIGDHVIECLQVEYANGEFLYVPVDELDVLNRYVTYEGFLPNLDRMGGNTWRIKQKKARKSIMTFARDLLELYALRKSVKGVSYERDHSLESDLDRGFSFVETEDQKQAIGDVMRDLEASYPMDRLLCGDVSFGKTEVAIRAAFRVVVNGGQVAVLCPTTILAYQHFSTFKKRFSPFPVRIEMISRMVSKKERTAIIEDLNKGKVDIVIGTHSLISGDIPFKKLGLYVIDEEQRFGVFQKEKLKRNREDIDVLSMSATPIPRTMSLSMAGLHDISVIRTPPIGRMAIKNYVGVFSKSVLMSAIYHEIDRGGQAFVVYNNISKIFSVKEKLENWMPGITMTVIHAKMRTEIIEKNLMDFIQKKYQVLVSTTIIENGIDIPDVNTLIVMDAHRFGLTQLYQLRGRIGRGSRQAYAYFLIDSESLTDQARARLEAIRDFAELGSGYQLAEFDLKLRGAGSLLGNKQHGHIEALGFDYYHKMLLETIEELKGEMKKKKEPQCHFHFNYSINQSYIPNPGQRVALYKRILEVRDWVELEELGLEMTDRYGRPPADMERIYFAGFVRMMTRIFQIPEADVYLERLILKFQNPATVRSILESDISRMIPLGPFDEDGVVFYFKNHTDFMEVLKQHLFPLFSL